MQERHGWVDFMNIQKIISGSVDLHVHVGPDIIPRKFDVGGLVSLESRKISAICAKSHFFPILPRKEEKIEIVGSVTLNRFVGGLNPDIVEIVASMSKSPIIVWFPTINAENYLNKS